MFNYLREKRTTNSWIQKVKKNFLIHTIKDIRVLYSFAGSDSQQLLPCFYEFLIPIATA